MNISIFASIGCQNIGDELILKNEIELLRQEFSLKKPLSNSLLQGERTDCSSFLLGGERIQDRGIVGDKNSSPSSRGIPAKQEGELFFKVASYDHKNPVFQIDNTQYFEYFPLGIKNPKNILRNIKNFLQFLRVITWSDIVVIGGGGIIYDSELQSVKNPLNQWIFRTRIARYFRKKIYFYALGIDIKNKENVKKLEKIFKNAWKVTVRDEKSQKQLSDIGIESEIVDDPVMSENALSVANAKSETNSSLSSRGIPAKQEGELVNILGTQGSKNFTLADFEKYNFQGKQVGLALRSGYIGKSGNLEVEKLLVEELCSYIESKGGSIMFLPHSLHKTDTQANDYEFMKQFLTPEREILDNLQSVYEWYRYQNNKMILSMRLHSIILASVYGIPQIVLSYSQKTDEVIKKLSK